MSIQELEQYLSNNELPSQIKLNKATTINNTATFIDTNLSRLKLWKGDINKHPSYWHLMELVKVIQSDPNTSSAAASSSSLS